MNGDFNPCIDEVTEYEMTALSLELAAVTLDATTAMSNLGLIFKQNVKTGYNT
jgi:hypothetical protein